MGISILIPIYNGEKTIKRALFSIINQKNIEEFGPLQVECILNCCSDNSEQQIIDFKKENSANKLIQIEILHCSEKGITPALNTGLLNSKYDLIARLDDDDFWYPEKLYKQYKFISENPEIDILGTQMNLVDIFGKQLGITTKNPITNNDIKNSMLSGHNAISHPSVLFKKRVLLRTGMYDDTFPVAGDYAFWLRAMCWYNFANLEEVLMDYTSSHNPNYNPAVPQFMSYITSNIFQFLKEIKAGIGD